MHYIDVGPRSGPPIVLVLGERLVKRLHLIVRKFLHAALPTLASRPVVLVWSEKDVVFEADALDRFRADFPAAEVLRIPAGHFVQEDAHEIVVPALIGFLARHAREAGVDCSA